MTGTRGSSEGSRRRRSSSAEGQATEAAHPTADVDLTALDRALEKGLTT